jgi:hypothetical protein
MYFEETFDTFKRFYSKYEDCLMCSCDHGCNQWNHKQRYRLALSIRMIRNNSKNLDKMCSMSVDRVSRIYFWLFYQDVRRANKKYNKEFPKIK